MKLVFFLLFVCVCASPCYYLSAYINHSLSLVSTFLLQEFSDILHQDNMSIPNEYLSENYSSRNVNFDELLEVLKESKFQPLESEYHLASRLSMVCLSLENVKCCNFQVLLVRYPHIRIGRVRFYSCF